MAIDFTNVAPKATVMPADTRGRQAVDRGPNPFLENGWLMATYESGVAAELVFPGKEEKYMGTERATGAQVEKTKIVGDAAEVIRMIREAADKLLIGARIVTTLGGPGVKEADGTPVKRGNVLIQYLGQTRKAPRKAKTV